MATADIVKLVTMPSIHQPLTKDDLMGATEIRHINNILNSIITHDLSEKFQVHLLHRHDLVENGTIKVESDLEGLPGKWNKPTQIDSLDLGNVHGVMYRPDTDKSRFAPVKFAHGPLPISWNGVVASFLGEVAEYFMKNNLADSLALEIAQPVKPGQPRECTAELEVGDYGTVTLPQSMVVAKESLPTGWSTISGLGDSEEPPPGQTWSKMVNEAHKIFINKPIGGAQELVDELVGQQVVIV
ncbi:hypothetical protein F4810DRAFT_702683 [Camillea tinctor]|nr:hypothetical protein F4810DRAFT_702683 [Camillea tinctor]